MIGWIIEVPAKIRLEIKSKIDLGQFEAAPWTMNTERLQKTTAPSVGVLIPNALDIFGSKTDVAIWLQIFGIGIIDPDPVMLQTPFVTGNAAVRGIDTFWNQVMPKLPVQKVHLGLTVKVNRQTNRVDGVTD